MRTGIPVRRRAAGSRRAAFRLFFALLIFTLPVPPGLAQIEPTDLDTIRAGEHDYGRMWTFEYSPADYFIRTYGFDATPEWFERARLSVLRVPGCSASFVSGTGLVATNHHCVRGQIFEASRPGEALLDSGFVARTLEEERLLPDYYADQLLAAVDVTDEVMAATRRAAETDGPRARQAALAEIGARLKDRHAAAGDSVWVETVALYDGARYSAYVFRRFTDVRLVVAAELRMGQFGGDSDNFTYPRYDLDFAFLRVYDRGEPFRPAHYFRWGEGVEAGDAVFVIGNPGRTNRLKSVAQLEFQRDVEVPVRIAWLERRLHGMAKYRAASPDEAEAAGIRPRMLSFSNSLKASEGRLAALRDPAILARKRDAERVLQSRAGADLASRFGTRLVRLAAIQQQRATLAQLYGAFYRWADTVNGSASLARAVVADAWETARIAGTLAASADSLRAELDQIRPRPYGLERELLSARVEELVRYLGPDHAIARAALAGRSMDEAADALLEGSELDDPEATLAMLEAGVPLPEDALLTLARAAMPAYRAYRETWERLTAEEEVLEAEVGRFRFAVYGPAVPPDGTSSPRITDGVVQGYEYNGTLAPPYTTFYGMYDRYHGHGHGLGTGEEWALPDRWRAPPPGLDLSTPLNFVSTADTYGGNSGSPAVTPELELVGLNFDRNIEGLSRDFIYLPERGRNVMVDVRAIRAALAAAYGADRIAEEIQTGRAVDSEEKATAAAEAAR